MNIALVNLKDDAQADAAYETLLGRFGAHDEIAKVVGEVAWAYRRQKRYADSLRIYRRVLANWPDSDSALVARRGIVFSLIGLADAEGADAEVAGMLADYEGDEAVAAVALQLADEFRKKKLYESALGLYEYVADNYAESKEAVTAQRKVVTTHINLKDEPAAQQALDELTLRFADDPKLSRELYEVGEYYRKRKNYPSARALYDYVATEFPQTNDALWSAQRQIVIDIDETEDPNNPTSEVPPEIMLAIEDLIVDCNGLPQLTRAVFYFGEDYYLRGMKSLFMDVKEYRDYFKGAISIFELVINDLAFEKTYTPFAYYLCALCCERTGQWDKAIAYYKKLTEDGYRHGRYAYRAPRQLGFIYRHKKKDYEKAAYWYDQQNKLFDKDSAPPERGYGGRSGQMYVCDRAMWSLATVYRLDLKDYDKALEAYLAYLREFPQGSRANLVPRNIARCELQKGGE